MNVLVVGFLVRAGWPARSAEAPAPISIQIVDHMPGNEAAGSRPADRTSDAPPRPDPSAQEKKADRAEAAADKAPPTPAEPPPALPTAEPAKPSPPEPAEATPEPEKAEAHEAEAANPASPPPPQATPATPPPLEHPDNNPQPRLVEAPPTPAPSATQPDAAVTPPAPPVPPDDPNPKSAEPPRPRPDVLASATGDEAVAPPAPKPEIPPALTAEQKRQAETTAKLAAALPFGPPAGLDPFQARLGGSGDSASQSYRGAVYGSFAKASDVVAEARAKRLRGQAVVAFSLDDRGNLANLAVAVSSRNPEIDRMALELIRRSAPFPPPPTGAQRHFSPAIGFGLDE